MISTRHSQSLTDFSRKSTETLNRLDETGEAEILTVNGEARAVLLSPAAFDELTRGSDLAQDTRVIRQAIQEIEDGKGQEAEEFFEGLRGQLLSMKASASQGTGK